jgi:hypothetical protein
VVNKQTAQPFAPALVPMFVLQPASVPLLTQYMEEQTDAPGTLVAFVKYLAAQPQPLYAIDLEFGVFRTHSLEHLKYAEAFLNFYQVRSRLSPQHLTAELSSDRAL